MLTYLRFLIISIHSLFVLPAMAYDSLEMMKSHPAILDGNHIQLPLNEYSALSILAKWHVSSSELPFEQIEMITTQSLSKDLWGNDVNRNLIRDDYEKILLSSYQRPEYVVMGLLASKRWDRILELINDQTISTAESLKLMKDMIAINRCYFQLQQIDQHLRSPILDYFNTPERLQVKEQAEIKLLKNIGNRQHHLVNHNNPCDFFGAMAEKIMKEKISYAKIKHQ